MYDIPSPDTGFHMPHNWRPSSIHSFPFSIFLVADPSHCIIDCEKKQQVYLENRSSSHHIMHSTTSRSSKFTSFTCYISYFYFLPKALSNKINSLTAEEGTITKRQAELKKELYGRFGDSINLETWGDLREKVVVLQLGMNSSIGMKHKFINKKIMILWVLLGLFIQGIFLLIKVLMEVRNF